MMLLLMLLLQKKEEKKNLGRFPHFWARGTKNRINTGRSINKTRLRYKFKIGVFLDIEDTYTVAKWIQWSTLLLSYYKMSFSV